MKKRVVVFSGAGLSAESGIPTFRGSDGLWENHRIEDVASPDGWARNPKLVLEFYAMRFEKIHSVQPNAGHMALAQLQEKFDVINITQNIDNLLERAGNKTVWHLHGRVDWQKCERHYDIFGFRDSYFNCDFKSEISKPVQWGDKCPKCGAQLRPDIVWFGESVDMRRKDLEELIDTASIFIGVGTSAQVYPAANLLSLFANTEQKFFIDPNPAYEALRGFKVIESTATSALVKLVQDLMQGV
ncbi:MAG: SIR2 family NAD-dependent protein deacylase [Chloroherpetonaceae bacterium]